MKRDMGQPKYCTAITDLEQRLIQTMNDYQHLQSGIPQFRISPPLQLVSDLRAYENKPSEIYGSLEGIEDYCFYEKAQFFPCSNKKKSESKKKSITRSWRYDLFYYALLKGHQNRKQIEKKIHQMIQNHSTGQRIMKKKSKTQHRCLTYLLLMIKVFKNEINLQSLKIKIFKMAQLKHSKLSEQQYNSFLKQLEIVFEAVHMFMLSNQKEAIEHIYKISQTSHQNSNKYMKKCQLFFEKISQMSNL